MSFTVKLICLDVISEGFQHELLKNDAEAIYFQLLYLPDWGGIW